MHVSRHVRIIARQQVNTRQQKSTVSKCRSTRKWQTKALEKETKANRLKIELAREKQEEMHMHSVDIFALGELKSQEIKKDELHSLIN